MEKYQEYYTFVTGGTKEQIDPWMEQLDKLYAAGNPALSDELYDHLFRAYEARFGKRTVVGAPPPATNKVELPVAMMSLDKIMTDKELQSFVKKNPGEYVVMSKVNGNAGLYEIKDGKTKLYNRGDGTVGTDLSHILPYLNLPVLPFDVNIKGEFVIEKKDYEPYKQDYKTNLSMTAGLLNSLSADPLRLKLIKFIAYDMSFPSNQNIELNMLQTLEYLVKYGFRIPFNTVTPALTIEWLSALFKQLKNQEVYDLDGLVVVSNRPIKYGERLLRENPKYAVAFKEYGETAVATVNNIVWEASKHRVVKPTIKIEPVTIGEFTIKSLTGFNAGWVWDNQVGIGTQLLITHNTIPHILGVLKPTEAFMPPENLYPKGSWEWNATHVDIVLFEDTDETRIAKIYEFFKQIDAKYWGETTIRKLYHGGFNTIKIMLESTREDFLRNPIDGVGAGIIDRMVRTRDEALPNITLPMMMSASSCFGIGFGQRRLSAIVDKYPNILTMNVTTKDIVELEGFAEKTAVKFIEGLPKFKQFLAEIPLLQQILRGEIRPKVGTPITQLPVAQVVGSPIAQVGNFQPATAFGIITPVQPVAPIAQPVTNVVKKGTDTIRGKSVVFTGFRDKALENVIKAQGGDVKTGVSKKVNYVVVGGVKGEGSAKEQKAIEYGIPILNLQEFRSMFGL